MSATSAGSTSRFTGVLAEQDVVEDLVLVDTVGAAWSDLSLDQGGADVAGAHRVAGDAPAGRLQGDDLGETFETVLGRDVRHLVRRRSVAVHGGDVDEAAPATVVHAGEQSPGQAERRLEHQPLDEAEPLGVEVLDGRDVLDAALLTRMSACTRLPRPSASIDAPSDRSATR